MPFGSLYGLLFFTLLAVAAWTSSISMLEPGTAWLVERFGVGNRKRAALLLSTTAWLLGLVSVLSFNHWSDIKLLGRNLMELIDFIASDLMMPVGAILIALFTGWSVKTHILRKELPDMPAGLFTLWRWMVRVVAPMLVLVIFIGKLTG